MDVYLPPDVQYSGTALQQVADRGPGSSAGSLGGSSGVDGGSDSTEGAPVVLFCHGGVWASGAKWHYAPLATRLAQAGVVTAVMQVGARRAGGELLPRRMLLVPLPTACPNFQASLLAPQPMACRCPPWLPRSWVALSCSRNPPCWLAGCLQYTLFPDALVPQMVEEVSCGRAPVQPPLMPAGGWLESAARPSRLCRTAQHGGLNADSRRSLPSLPRRRLAPRSAGRSTMQAAWEAPPTASPWWVTQRGPTCAPWP
jgi:hypothetical protein